VGARVRTPGRCASLRARSRRGTGRHRSSPPKPLSKPLGSHCSKLAPGISSLGSRAALRCRVQIPLRAVPSGPPDEPFHTSTLKPKAAGGPNKEEGGAGSKDASSALGFHAPQHEREPNSLMLQG